MRRISILLLIILAAASTSVSAAMRPSAAAKLDPRLLLLYNEPSRFAKSLAQTVSIQGPSLGEAIVPVLIKGRASKTTLEAAGACVGSRHGDITTLRIPLAKLEALASISEVDAVEASYHLHEMIDVSVEECGGQAVQNGSPSYLGRGVIVGLLDTGIDPVHEDFVDENGKTRVLYIWDQWDYGSPPAGYDYGREWTKAQIDAGLCYMEDWGAHGSHCAGIACGDGSSSTAGYVGMAPGAEIIVVSNLGEEFFTYGYAPPWHPAPSTVGSLDGLAWMNSKSLQENKPLVVSWSQGVSMGPHDGSTLFEQGVTNFVTENDVPVVIAAGNDQQSYWHAAGLVSEETPLVASFTTANPEYNFPTSSVMFEAWYALGDEMSLELVDPYGGTSRLFGPNESGLWPGDGFATSTGDTLFIYSNADHPVSHKGYFLVLIANRSTDVAQGIWQVRLSAVNSLPEGGEVDMWFERNQYSVKWQDHVSLEKLVAMPGSSKETITVAAYNSKVECYDIDGNSWGVNETLGAIAGFSSNGPTADGRLKPEISAPGQIVASVLSSGAAPFYLEVEFMRTYVAPDGLHLYMQGTSMAAPHVAGAVALMLEKNPALAYTRIREILTSTARHDQWTGTGWSKAFGWGKLDARAAVDSVVAGSGTTYELIYDDNDPAYAYLWSSARQGVANRMSPPQYPVTLLKISYYISGGPPGASFSAQVLDFNGIPGNEITTSVSVTPQTNGWLDIDLESQEIQITREFAVGMLQEGETTPSFGYDSEDNMRAWDFDGADWALAEGTYFIRATVQTGLSAEEDLTLAAFRATLERDVVTLTWESEQLPDYQGYGFNVYRSLMPEASKKQRLNHRLLHESTYQDRDILPGETYSYWLETVSTSGLGMLHGPLTVSVDLKPGDLYLQSPRPTPSNGNTVLSFYVPGPGQVELSLYDVAGRKTSEIIEVLPVARGWHTVSWNPKQENIAAGKYICRLTHRSGKKHLSSSQLLIVVK